MFVEYWIGPATGLTLHHTIDQWLFPWLSHATGPTYCLWLVPGTHSDLI